MSARYLQIRDTTDAPNWDITVTPPGTNSNTHVLAIDPSTDVPTWKTVKGADQVMSCDDTTSVVAWAT